MVNMCDDHDLIDGFGSYPDDLQRSAFFKQYVFLTWDSRRTNGFRSIGSRGYFWFLLFQQFINDAVDGTLIEPGQHTFASTIIGNDGPYIPFPSHSSLHYFGPRVSLLVMDCRAERRKDLILTPDTYERVLGEVNKIEGGVEHLIVLLGIPIAYPRMNLTEKIMASDSLLAKVARNGIVLPSMTNHYNKDSESFSFWTCRRGED